MAQAAAIRNDISAMQNTLNTIMELERKIGGFGDGIQLREQLQMEVKDLLTKSQTVKNQIKLMQERNDPYVDDIQNEFQGLATQMQSHLPKVVQKLRSNESESHTSQSGGVVRQPLLLEQDVLDEETEMLDELEQQIGAILTQMRAVNELFTKTHEEIQKQRHILTGIDTYTSEAMEEMSIGVENIKKSQKHHIKSTKCLCWIWIILGVIAGGIILYLILS